MPLEPGVRLGPYEVVSGLGAGGMGEVYRARDHRLERDVAIKVLPTHFKAGSRQLKLFEQEARLLASLNHSSICAIYDVGSDRGISFIVMEHLLGETLGARIERGPIPVNVALHYAIQIVDALHTAHGAGLVHRDIKPGNIMLTTTGVKLLDFGLAKRHMGPATPPPVRTGAVTATGDATDREGIVGTLHYMAPEQLSGGVADARSDIWAFGCVVYEMVAGRRAFTGKTLTEVIAAIVTDRPPIMTIEKGVVPLALEHLVARCLARDPAERWQTTGALARELRSMLPHAKSDPAPVAPSPHVAPPAPQTVPMEEHAPGKSSTKIWVAAAAVALLLAVAGGWFLSRGFVTRSQQSVAVLPFASAGGAADVEYLAEGLADGVVAELARIPQVRAVASSVAFRYRPTSNPRSTGGSLGVDRIMTGRLAIRAGRVELETELTDVATGSSVWSSHYSEPVASVLPLQRKLIAGVLTALQLRAAKDDVALASIPSELNSEVYRLLLKGRYAASRRNEGSLKNAIGFFTDAVDKDSRLAAAHAGVADAYSGLAHSTVAALRPDDAFPKVKKAATKALELDPSLASAHLALGLAKTVHEWDWKGAGAEYERAIALQPGDPLARQWRSEWLMVQGRTDEALTEARNAVQLDPLSPSASLNLGWQLYLARQYADATEQLKAAIERTPNSASAHWALGAVYDSNGRPDDAIREFKAATTIAPGKPVYLAGLAYANARARHTQEATQILERLRAMSAREYVSPFDIALVALALDDSETAFKSLQQAVAEHASAVVSLPVDPRLDPLRADSRFKDLLKRTGL